MHGLEIDRLNLRRPDETGLVSLMSASTGIAVLRWFVQQRQGRADSGRSPDDGQPSQVDRGCVKTAAGLESSGGPFRGLG